MTLSHDACHPVVVEVKKGTIDLSACGQMLGYMSQMEVIFNRHRRGRLGTNDIPYVLSLGFLVGAGIDRAARRVIASANISFFGYTRSAEGEFVFIKDYDGTACDMSNYDPRIDEAIEMLVENHKVCRIQELMFPEGFPR